MIILDTNVISELMRPEPAASVLRWMSAQPAGVLHVTTISYAEILFGLYLMPDGRRRQRLTEQAMTMFFEDFAGCVLGFDMAAGPAYAAIVGDRQRAGRPLNPVDGMIASIARIYGATIATRDTDLLDCGVPVVNPWDVQDHEK
jgi:toxin FitB